MGVCVCTCEYACVYMCVWVCVWVCKKGCVYIWICMYEKSVSLCSHAHTHTHTHTHMIQVDWDNRIHWLLLSRVVVIYEALCFDVARGQMNGHLMRLEPTRIGLLVYLANNYIARRALLSRVVTPDLNEYSSFDIS